LAFDFDGTLAPIVDDPARAAMRPQTRHLLAEVARLYPCAVISGRAEGDVLRPPGGVTVWDGIGDRAPGRRGGGERLGEQGEAGAQEVGAGRAVVREVLGPLKGVTLEDKGVSLALHFRQAADREQACAVIKNVASTLRNARVIEGKNVVNLLPADAPTKATAGDRLRVQLGCEPTLYVGGDKAEGDGFGLPGVTGVKVGIEGESAARFYLRDQTEMDDLLERLLGLRERRAIRPEAMRRQAQR